MNHGSMKSHILWVVGVGTMLLLTALFSGFNIQSALPIAISLACPVGMVCMMFFMEHSMHHEAQYHDDEQPHDRASISM